MEDLHAIVKKQIDQLSTVELTSDLINRIDMGKLADKAKDIITTLNNSNESLDELINKGHFKTFLGSFGKNDKILANAEKSVVDSAKFNIGLSCLLVLFSKAIKNQQDVIVDQQSELQYHQQRLEDQGNDILKIQGLTKEQADKIVLLLQADEYVRNKIEEAKSEIMSELTSYRTQIDHKFDQFREVIDSGVSTVREQSSQSVEMSKKELEIKLAIVSEDLDNQHNSMLSEVTRVSEKVSSVKAEFLETIRANNALLSKRIWWSFAISTLCVVLLILKIIDVI